ncbi:uncharacterized protein LOC124930046 [Impatiens glandulifera]|uniref:uncharacterized protein LOC124930046 n=1 Tax=Impatiens glandulifera TaxID=253017 RepID=UPI001FB17FFA|nr:uncharacterized protein LOC124930046 [Impatiens glandulifera]
MSLVAIYQVLSDDVLLMVAEKDYTKLARKTLKTMYVGVDRVKEAKLQTLKTQFEVICMKNGESMDDFSMKLTTIATGICSLGEKMEEIFVVKNFLRVVPQTYMQIITVIEQFGDLKNMTVEDLGTVEITEVVVKGKVEDEVMHKVHLDKKTPSLAKTKSTLKCYACQKYGHYASEFPNKRHDDEANLTSFYEKESALMFIEGMMNALPEDNETNLEEFVQESSKEELEVVMFNEKKVKEKLLASGDEYNQTDVWYLHNGANNHMTSHQEKLSELDKKITGNVSFEDGNKVHRFPDPACGKICMSNDIVFEEEKKW